MARDQFLEAILVRLEAGVDPHLFETAANDLLRDAYPTLVQIPGGNDSGRDGIVAGTPHEAAFLVATTQENPGANLRKSIRSHKDHGKLGRKVVFATSQDLSATKRDELQKIASAEGYSLLQTYDRTNLALLLYRRPDWCLRLLDLPGDPPPLSKIPRSDRPGSDTAIVGRSEDLAWLSAGNYDCVLAGQPGSGKTFLLRTFVEDHAAFFVNTDDIGQIAGGVRENTPQAVIVDDAHRRLETLRSLVHFREQSAAAYRIIATCWPAEKESVRAVLQLRAAVRELERLTRDQIVEVIHGCGILGPAEFVYEVVNQADGRPGLAVTLCEICLREGVAGVRLAEILAQDTRRTIEPLGRDAYPLLAGFAVGGDSGMELNQVAEALGCGATSAYGIATEMAAGGLLHEVQAGRLAVRPKALRHALVRDVFFPGGGGLNSEALIARASNKAQVVETLAGARARGAKVPLELLLRLARESRGQSALEVIAWVGPEEAGAVLEASEKLPGGVIRACLEHVPERVIPRLLDSAKDDTRALLATPDHPMRTLTDWVQAGRPGTEEAVRRRVILHTATLQWLRKGGSDAIGVQGLMSALSLKYDAVTPDPGSGMRMNISWGRITDDEVKEVFKLWPETVAYLRVATSWNWDNVRHLVEGWCYPGRHSATSPADRSGLVVAAGTAMLRDLVPLASSHPGVQHWIMRTADALKAEIPIDLDPDFLTIYPIERSFEKEGTEAQAEAARRLGRAWALRPLEEVVPRLVHFAEEAKHGGISWPQYDGTVCWEIAENTHEPVQWAQSLINLGSPGDFARPFLHFASQGNVPGWEDVASACLSSDAYRFLAMDIILSAPNAPEALLDRAIYAASGHPDWLHGGIARQTYSSSVLRRLLLHENRRVAGETADWIWRVSKRVPDALRTEWRAAVIRGIEDVYEPAALFAIDSNLALDWLRARIGEASSALWKPNKTVRAAVQCLTEEECKLLLQELDGQSSLQQGLVVALIGTNADLYIELLNCESLRDFHLFPLHGKPGEHWGTLAPAALKAGYSFEEVAAAAFAGGFEWTGKLSSMWQEYVEAFAELEEHADVGLREVGRRGRALAEAERDKEIKRERNDEVFGR